MIEELSKEKEIDEKIEVEGPKILETAKEDGEVDETNTESVSIELQNFSKNYTSVQFFAPTMASGNYRFF